MMIAVMAAYVISSPDEPLDAIKIFVTYSLIMAWSTTMQFLPLAVNYTGQVMVSLKRIKNFLLLEEASLDDVRFDAQAGKTSISLQLLCTAF